MKLLESLSVDLVKGNCAVLDPSQFEVLLTEDDSKFSKLEKELIATIIALHAGMKDADDEAAATIGRLNTEIGRLRSEIEL